MFDKCVVTKIAAIIEYLSEEVMIRGVVHDDIGKFVVLDDSMECDDAWMCRGNLMEGNLSYVELSTVRTLIFLVFEV